MEICLNIKLTFYIILKLMFFLYLNPILFI